MAEEKERRRTRIRSTITDLPEEVRQELDQKLLDKRNSFVSIAEWSADLGHPVSKSAIGRYAMHVNKAAERVAETLEKTRCIIQAVEANPDLDYTMAGRIMMMDGLIQKVSTAEEEFLEMPLEKAGRLIASLSRVEVYDQKAKRDYKNKMQVALDGLEAELGEAIRTNPQLAKEFHTVMRKARQQLFTDDG